MKEIVYRFNTLGAYEAEEPAAFGEEALLNLIVEPHDFSIAVGREVLRQSSCKGYQIEVSRKGAIVLRNAEGTEICRKEGQDRDYREVRLLWKQGFLSLQFGQVEYIDNYPNCDGEHDRWDERWRTEYEVTLDEGTNTLTHKIL